MTSDRAGDDEVVLFLSDLHLCEARPDTTSAFLAFLGGPASCAARIYILGDLFEYWAGDDDENPFTLLIAESLSALARAGARVLFMAGNRDFLLGASYAERAGIERLDDPHLLSVGGEKLLLSHGDQLCTDDTAYQAFRSQVRDLTWQQGFLAQPLSARRKLVEDIRERSESEKSRKPSQIMDVNASAVDRLLREYAYPTLIHGHTHRPARHEHVVDGRRCSRIVLPDWHDTARYLEWSCGTLADREYIP